MQWCGLYSSEEPEPDNAMPPNYAASDQTRREYDGQAAEWKRLAEECITWVSESHTLRSMAGDLAGKHVLDVACGEGRSSRALLPLGPASLLGVDLSPENIKNANAALEEDGNPGDVCKYAVHDFLMPLLDADEHPIKYDKVCACYLLSYAPTRESLAEFVANLFEALHPGGEYMGLEDNPEHRVTEYGGTARYGYVKTAGGKVGDNGLVEEGGEVRYHFFSPQFESCVWIWSKQTYEKVFKAAGFEALEWVPMAIPPEVTGQEREALQPYVEILPQIGLRAKKPMLL
eukprot:TRINITY_DN12649_c0_g1_i2.p1 TRINITY_DN12649_c0_g1~~TRINITY_DN12649_c0_g1_i2.p1  ORF type:complete len:288 (-),score=66.42 TRINITY_DN12649_c0_g1_i2:169-1032(-)